ncbi:retention module-containing protein, partial [Halomonas halmophila]|uniref:retention module-containing protein n=1 Tax=Halomonas halmophila TaxID=252 RepID=UPI0011447E4F
MSTATVVSISGQAWARDSQGNLRELSEGDTLQEGETLVTGPNATVQLEWAGMAGLESVGGGQVVEIGADPEASTPAPFAESDLMNADAEAILSAIEDGEGDLLQLLEAPAAGGSGGSGGGAQGGGGHSFVRIERISESLDPLSFEFGTFSNSDVDTEQGGLAADAEEEIAAADDTFATGEDAPLAGANVLPNDTGVDGSALSVGDPGPRNVTFTLPDGSEVQASVSVAEDGSISFDPGTTFQSLGEGGSATGTFNYELTDTEGRTDTAEVNLTVNGSNDALPEVVIEDNAPDLANADLSVVEATSDSASGTATVSAEAGVADVTIGGVSITDASNNPVTIPGEEGVLTVTGYDASTGDITYEYTEDGDAEDHSDGPVQDQFTLNVEDNAGETTSSSLNVRIEDTEPNAVDDTTTSEEDEAVVYNVMGNDDEGADGSTLTSASLADTSQGDIDFGPDGDVTFT